MKNIFKDVGHSIESGSKSIAHVFTGAGNTVKSSVSDVYHDSRSAVSSVYHDTKTAAAYTGKHLINDVDSLTNMISNPLLWVVVGGVVLVVLTRR